jgi:hypothetical protein
MPLTSAFAARQLKNLASVSQHGFRKKDLLNWVILQQLIKAEGLLMESDRGAHVLKCFFVSVTLANDHSIDAKWISDVSIAVALHDHLQSLGCHRCLLHTLNSSLGVVGHCGPTRPGTCCTVAWDQASPSSDGALLPCACKTTYCAGLPCVNADVVARLISTVAPETHSQEDWAAGLLPGTQAG